MESESKRVLTSSVRQAHQAADNSLPSRSTSPDLALQLRNLGARVRRNVSQGYLQPPSREAFSKSASSDSIFCSSNDTLRKVFAAPIAPGLGYTPDSPKKRPHSLFEPESDRDANGVDHDNEMKVDAGPSSIEPLQSNLRPIRPLRTARKSMSDTALFQRPRDSTNSRETPRVPIEEEDWSSFSTSPQDNSSTPFQPQSFM